MAVVHEFSSLRYLILFTFTLLFCIVNGKGTLYDLDENNWDTIVEGEWMLQFFAPWCPACKVLSPIWKDFADWSDDLGIKVAHVDVTANPGLSGRFMVTALPTIYHVKDGEFRQYRGSRDKEAFINFIEEKKWQTLEAIPSWKAPQSYQMSAVSYFFKLSMTIRGIHTQLVDEFGVPYWASYILFALATIVLGAILGLMVVCVIDLIFPPRHEVPVPQYELGDKLLDNEKEPKEHLSDDEDEEVEAAAEEETIDDSTSHEELRKRKLVSDAKSA